MTKTHALILAVTSLAVGVFIGGSLGKHAIRDSATSLIGAQTVTTVCALENLRAGDTNGAIRLLEGDLDSSLLTLGAFISGTPPTLRHSLVRPAQLARDYYAKFPSTYFAGSSEQIG